MADATSRIDVEFDESLIMQIGRMTDELERIRADLDATFSSTGRGRPTEKTKARDRVLAKFGRRAIRGTASEFAQRFLGGFKAGEGAGLSTGILTAGLLGLGAAEVFNIGTRLFAGAAKGGSFVDVLKREFQAIVPSILREASTAVESAFISQQKTRFIREEISRRALDLRARLKADPAVRRRAAVALEQAYRNRMQVDAKAGF